MTELETEKRYCTRCLTTFEADPEQCPNLSCRRKRPRDSWGRIYREGDVFDRNYRIHRMLAVGGAGVTYVARELGPAGDEIGPLLAIKVLLAARDQGPYVRRLATEAQIIQELDHPNIVQYLGFVHRAGHSPYLITRFEAGGSLLDHMRRVGTLPVKTACGAARQICWALEKAHERGIVHRDLKPENVLLARPVEREEDAVIRVADFGIAKVQGGLGAGLTRVGAFVGTPHYAAPEQFVGGAVSEAADVYAVGALLYFTMMARHVVRFADRLDPEDSFQLLCDNLPATVVRDQDPMADVERINQVLAVAMQVDPALRCTVVELDAMLAAVMADTDPAIPRRQRPDAAAELPAEGHSLIGLAGALATQTPTRPSDEPSGEAPTPAALEGSPSVAPPAPAPVAPVAAQESGLATLGAVAAGAAAAGALVAAAAMAGRKSDPPARPGPAPATLTPAPPKAAGVAPPFEGTQPTLQPVDNTASPEDREPTVPVALPPPKPKRWLRRMAVGILALGLLGGGGVAVGGAWLWTQRPELIDQITKQLGLPSVTGGNARSLSANDANPAHQKDYRAIQSSLSNERSRLQSLCGISKGTSLQADLVVTGAGVIRSAKVSGGGSAGNCVADRLMKMQLRRTETDTVRVRIPLAW